MTTIGGRAAASTKTSSSSAKSTAAIVANTVVVVAALAVIVLVLLIVLGWIGNADDTAAGKATPIITASGAIITGLLGAYFGVSIAHRAQDTTADAHKVAQTAQDQATRSREAVSLAMSVLDPNDAKHRDVIDQIHQIMG